jgi:hypothetical protein
MTNRSKKAARLRAKADKLRAKADKLKEEAATARSIADYLAETGFASLGDAMAFYAGGAAPPAPRE